jgi:hypothetical protein
VIFLKSHQKTTEEEAQQVLLPSKGINRERSLLAIGAVILSLLKTPTSVSGLWERFATKLAKEYSHSKITFDWFVLALTMLYAIDAVNWNGNEQLERCNVSS